MDDSTSDVALVDRQTSDSLQFPALMQILRFVMEADGTAHEWVLFQLYATAEWWERPRRNAIVRADLTCTADQVAMHYTPGMPRSAAGVWVYGVGARAGTRVLQNC